MNRRFDCNYAGSALHITLHILHHFTHLYRPKGRIFLHRTSRTKSWLIGWATSNSKLLKRILVYWDGLYLCWKPSSWTEARDFAISSWDHRDCGWMIWGMCFHHVQFLLICPCHGCLWYERTGFLIGIHHVNIKIRKIGVLRWTKRIAS